MTSPIVWVHYATLDGVAATGEASATLFRSPEGLDYEGEMVPMLAFNPMAELVHGTVAHQEPGDCMTYFYTIPTDGWGGMRHATLILHPLGDQGRGAMARVSQPEEEA